MQPNSVKPNIVSSRPAYTPLPNAVPLLSRENVVVVGLGYVGLPLSLLAHMHGYRVFGVDTDAQKCALITSGQVPDLDVRMLAALRHSPLPVSGSPTAVERARVVIICVPTPVDKDHAPDLTLAKEACRSVARHLRPGHLVILESTVHPGTSEEVLIPIMEQESGLTAGIDFDFAHCPERINPGDSEWPVEKIPRVVGGITPRSCKEAAAFYRSILTAPVHEMETIREAEAVKMVENSFRDINIAFVNELAMSFHKLKLDVSNVLRGASTKPFGFMLHSPGCGVGGHCIPVDPYYLIRYAEQNGFTHRFLSLARTINNGMPHFTVSLAEEALAQQDKKLEGAHIAILGLSYKADVGDLRESPAQEIIHALKEHGADVRTFDPHAPEISTHQTIAEVLDGADAAVIATAHREFSAMPPTAFTAQGVRVVIDGRNCLPKEEFIKHGITYRGIGR
jgi:nucleotide sugar dehydrogenase